MKAIFGVVGLLVVLAIVGVLARKQLGAGVAPAVDAESGAVVAPAASPQQQVQQFQQAVEGAMQVPARAMPDDAQ